MEKTDTIAALAALAQENRLDVFRLLVQAGPQGQIGRARDTTPFRSRAYISIFVEIWKRQTPSRLWPRSRRKTAWTCFACLCKPGRKGRLDEPATRRPSDLEPTFLYLLKYGKDRHHRGFGRARAGKPLGRVSPACASRAARADWTSPRHDALPISSLHFYIC